MICPACHKGDRAVLYCRRGDCPRLFGTAAVDLPPPTVDVSTADDGKTHVVVSRPNASGDPVGRSYEIDGLGVNDKIKDAVKKVLGDPYSAEWLPRR